MNLMKRVSVLTLMLVLAVSLFVTAAEQVKVTILHTNDVHGRATSYTVTNVNGEVGGLAKIATLISKIRANEDTVLLLDGGDAIHGTNIINLNRGVNMVGFYNAMGYDALVPGNHDFNYGYEHLLLLANKYAHFKIVTANVEKDSKPVFEPYTVIEKNGMFFGVIGASALETPIVTHPANVAGLDFFDPTKKVQEIVDKLKGNVDAIILLSHMGFEADKNIAEKVTGLDVIIGGHSHTVVDKPVIINGTIIAQSGEHGKNLGRVDLTLEDGKVVAAENQLIPVDGAVQKAPYMDVLIRWHEEKLRLSMSQVVGKTSVLLAGERAQVRTQETNLGNLVASIMLANCEADVAITNGGGIRASINVGDITIGEVYTVLPFDNTLVVVNVTGAQLQAALENGVSKFPAENGAFLHVAGLKFSFNPAKPAGERVSNVTVNGKTLELSKTYRVATNDFLAAGGDGFTSLSEGKVVYQSGLYLRDLMVSFLQANGVIPEVEGRITAIK